MKSIGAIMILVGAATFVYPALKPGSQVWFLAPLGDNAKVAGAIIGAVGILVLAIGFLVGRKPRKEVAK
jgi:hypothetical protein